QAIDDGRVTRARHQVGPPGPPGSGPAPKPGNSPIGNPPVKLAIDWAAASRALTRPALTAAAIKSSSSSASGLVNKVGSIRTAPTCNRPLTFAVTVPPPAPASTSICPSDSSALSNVSRNLEAFPSRSASIPSLLNTVISSQLGVGDAGDRP